MSVIAELEDVSCLPAFSDLKFESFVLLLFVGRSMSAILTRVIELWHLRRECLLRWSLLPSMEQLGFRSTLLHRSQEHGDDDDRKRRYTWSRDAAFVDYKSVTCSFRDW